jgi:3-hydroxyisobutyrate dehydrogenase-like beta-hydroxyacid dehydrogenase
MSRVGFVGLGNMGLAMAGRLVERGFALRAYNRSAARAEPLAAQGATVCASPAEAARGVELLVSMVADDAALRAITLGQDGVVAGLAPGGIHLSMSTVSPAVTGELAAAHAAAGSHLVAAPVLGRPPVAAAGNLWIRAAGAPELEERCRPLIEALCRGSSWLGGDPAQASVAKLAFNFILFGVVEALAEGLTLVEKHGIDRTRFFDALSQTFGSGMIEGYGRRMVERNFLPAGFTSRLALKDVGLILDAALAGLAPLPIGSLLRDHVISTLAHGRDEWDLAAIVEVLREQAGLA